MVSKTRTGTRGSTSTTAPDLAVARAAALPVRPDTWQGFLDAVRDARESLGKPGVIWYRGQSRDHFRLVPSLLRHPLGISKEQVLFNEYERSAPRLKVDKGNDWELLIDMQHYGIPTRLLDWTDVLGVALAFALYDSKDDHEDSAIYLLDPLALNKKTQIGAIKRVPNDATYTYKAIYWHSNPFAALAPIAMDCLLRNERIAAQSGYFTVHGANVQPIDDQAPECIRKIVLCSKVKPAVREFLEYANLNSLSIYPDVVGMARHIARKHLE